MAMVQCTVRYSGTVAVVGAGWQQSWCSHMTAATSLRHRGQAAPAGVHPCHHPHREHGGHHQLCPGVERAEVTGGGTCEDTRPGRDWAAGLAPAVMMSLLTAHSHMIQMIHCPPPPRLTTDQPHHTTSELVVSKLQSDNVYINFSSV